jgi:16S rRNA (guanine966-N2)-methyltransferase
MRIVGGQWSGRTLASPKSGATRPTTDATRESLFNILSHGFGHDPRKVLDLFAGTGALGFEALSRGAENVVFVDSDRAACSVIEKNAVALEAPTTSWRLLRSEKPFEWPVQLARCGEPFLPFDTIFCDPPYENRWPERALLALEKRPGLFASGALLCVETSTREPKPELSELWGLMDERERGTTRLLFYRRGG